jgi:hypothetical protein
MAERERERRRRKRRRRKKRNSIWGVSEMRRNRIHCRD